MSGRTYPSALAWMDIETTGLPEGNDFSKVEILELAVIVTDFDLKPYFGYHGIVGRTPEIDVALRNASPELLQMHKENGLLKDVRDSTDLLREHESEIVGMFKNKTTQNKGEFMIAGSGVAAYDFPLIKEKMPELASWFAYFSHDVGQVRRAMNIYTKGKEVVSVPESYREGTKKHRALDDVKAHLKEAEAYREFFMKVTEGL